MSDKPLRALRAQPLGLLQSLVLVFFEATLVYLVGAIVTGIGAPSPLRWWIVLAVVALSTFITARLEPLNADTSHIRPLTAIIAVVVIGWCVAWHIRAAGGGLALVSVLTDPDSDYFQAGYVALLAGTVAWLRGTRLLDVGHPEMIQHFRRGIIAVMLALGISTVAGFGQGMTPEISLTSANAPAWMIVFLVLGLLGLSITRIAAVEGDGGQSARWMWLRSSILSSLAIVLCGLVVLSVVASPARQVLRQVAAVVLYAFAMVLAPFAWLAFTLLEFLRETFLSGATLPTLPLPSATVQPGKVEPPTALPVPDGLLMVPTLLLLLVPVVVLVLLIFFATRRRAGSTAAEDERRESIFSWSGFGADISSLLGTLRRPRTGEGGLSQVLQALVAEDPATRIRRRYVQLLMKGESAEKHRHADETPREFVPTLATVIQQRAPVEALTAAYEQARYAPESVDQATADLADQAWHEVCDDQQPR